MIYGLGKSNQNQVSHSSVNMRILSKNRIQKIRPKFPIRENVAKIFIYEWNIASECLSE